MYMSYQERGAVLKKLPDSRTTSDIEALFKNIHRGPTGFVGLTRGLLATMLVLVLSIAVFHLVVFPPNTRVPDVAEKLLMLLAGALTTIIGFYFGSKASTQPPATGGGGSGGPKITSVDPGSGPASSELKVTGSGFGAQQGKGSVKFGGVAGAVITWNDTQIQVTVPAGLSDAKVDIVVTNDNGSSSAPWSFQITTNLSPPY
jgi:hypothetical protein